MYSTYIPVADIVSVDGKYITNDSWNGKVRLDWIIQYKWAPAKNSNTRAINTWRKVITTLFLVRANDRKLRQPLGQYLENVNQCQWLCDFDSNRVYTTSQQCSTWEVW